MSFVEVAIADAKAPEVQPEGVYNLVISKADLHRKEGSQSQSIRFIIEFSDAENAADIFHYQGLPSPGDESDKINNKLLMLKQFLTVFGIPFEGNGFNLEDCLGATGRCWVGQELDQNEIPRNVLRVYKKV